MRYVYFLVAAYVVYTVVRVARNASGYGPTAQFTAANLGEMFIYYAKNPTDWPQV